MIWDNNNITIDGARLQRRLAPTRSPASRPAAGTPSRSTAMTRTPSKRPCSTPRSPDKPTLIAAKTIIGFGAPKKAGHRTACTARRSAPRNWPAPRTRSASPIRPSKSRPKSSTPGALPAPARPNVRGEWQAALAPPMPNKRPSSSAASPATCRQAWPTRSTPIKESSIADKPKVATRKSSQMALEVINKVLPETLGGSADLTGSNLTNTPETMPFTGRRPHWPLHEVRHPRARDGGGDERHRAAWRA